MSHIILVAFEVEAPDRELAEKALTAQLHPLLTSEAPDSRIECWWVAEDDRRDKSDCDSAVFVWPGSQAAASRLLEQHGLTPAWNITPEGRRA